MSDPVSAANAAGCPCRADVPQPVPSEPGKFDHILQSLQNNPASGSDPRLPWLGAEMSMLNTLGSLGSTTPTTGDLGGIAGMGLGGLPWMGLGGGMGDPLQGLESMMQQVLSEVEQTLQVEQKILSGLASCSGTTPSTAPAAQPSPSPTPSPATTSSPSSTSSESSSVPRANPTQANVATTRHSTRVIRHDPTTQPASAPAAGT